MKKVILTLISLILVQALAMAQYTGGNGRGDFSLGYTDPVVVTASSGTTGPTAYTTLKAAFDAINNGTHQGTVTVTINASTTEAASAVLTATGGTANYASVNIYPTASGLSISGNLAAPLIDLNGADYVTIDGRVNQSGEINLTITNTSTSSTDGTSTIRFINDACNNTVKYSTVKGSSASSNSGIIYFSTTTGSTGNDNNTIDNNNITSAADANRPLNAIYSFGTAASENSNITISHNNIYDFLNRGSTSRGIYLYTNTTSCTISDNNIYETTPFVPTANTTYQLLSIYNTGNDFSVSGNYFGGNSPACGGTWTKTNAFDNPFYAMHLNVENGTGISVQGNTIKNFSWSNSGIKTVWSGISVNGANVNIGTTTGNTIGQPTGNGSITFNGGDSQGAVFGISVSGGGTRNIENNQIGSITVAGSNADKGHYFIGISNSETGTTNISNNTIGSETTPNSIDLTSTSAVDDQQGWGIYNDGTGSVTISGNTIANLRNGSTNSNPNDVSLIHGIISWDGSNIISDNTIHDLTIANANSNAFDCVSAAGILVSVTTAAVQSITGNTIYNLSNTYASFAGNVIGLYYSGSAMTSTVSGNFIHSISLNSDNSAASIYGIIHKTG